jgi:hypothetical protein
LAGQAIGRKVARVSALIGLLDHQPPPFFCKAHAVMALKLNPALFDGIEDRAGRSAGDTRQHRPSTRLPIGRSMDCPHNILG